MTGPGTGPQASLLPDGQRLHLNHGPIDLVLWADPACRATAYARAVARFRTLLDELVRELPLLRSPAPVSPQGPTARRMSKAVSPFVPVFITPMAAVAGAVADEVLAAMTGAPCLDPAPARPAPAGRPAGAFAPARAGTARAIEPIPQKIWINNGGDIAIHLGPDQSFTAAMPHGRLVLDHAHPPRGIATSGWRGRSQSLGIADAVTVLAATAAAADAAATMIANAVDLPDHPAITRRTATDVKADSDLGQRLVTIAVDPLCPQDRATALDAGLSCAEAFRQRGLIHGAFLGLQGATRATRPLPEHLHA